jgi:hypothetical protein
VGTPLFAGRENCRAEASANADRPSGHELLLCLHAGVTQRSWAALRGSCPRLSIAFLE